MKDGIDKRVITDEFLLEYFPSPTRYNELFPHPTENLKSLEEKLAEIRKEMDKERAKNNQSPLSDEEWERIAKNAYPIPISTLAVSEERYKAFRDSLNAGRAKSGLHVLSDEDLTSIIKHAEGYLMLSRNLKPNKQV